MKIREYCETKTNVKYIDTTSNLEDTAGYLKSPDYCGSSGDASYHLNSAGNEKWAKNIEEAIKSGGNSTTSRKRRSSAIIKSNEEKFLGLWKNSVGKYVPYYNDDGSINEDAKYKKEGKKVKYKSSQTPGEMIASQPEWFFSLLETTEKTQNHLEIMKYFLYVYTGKDYGVTSLDLSLFEPDSFVSGTAGALTGIPRQVFVYLTEKGMTAEGAAAILGNLHQESGLSPTAVNPSSGAYGLCQWLGDRKTGLENYARSKGVDPSDIETQIEFMWMEIDPSADKTYANQQISASDFEAMMNATDIERATHLFRRKFERCGEGEANDARRIEMALRYFEEANTAGGGEFVQTSDDRRVIGYYTKSNGNRHTVLHQSRTSNWGYKCNRAACAIIASGYTDESTDQLVNYMDSRYDGAVAEAIPSNSRYWNKYGLQITYSSTTKTHNYMYDLREQLASGGYAMFWIRNGGVYTGKSGTVWTKNMHWIAVIDYKNEGGTDKICIADWRGITWVDIDEFAANGVTYTVYVNEM